VTLHPPGRHFLDARVKIEGRPNADLHRLDGVSVLVGEQILFRTAQAHEHEPGAAPVDPVTDTPVLFRRQRAKGGRLAAGNLQVRPEATEFGLEPKGYVSIAAVEINGDAGSSRALAQPKHQLRSVNPLGQPSAMK
jgi:hypothetical protein